MNTKKLLLTTLCFISFFGLRSEVGFNIKNEDIESINIFFSNMSKSDEDDLKKAIERCSKNSSLKGFDLQNNPNVPLYENSISKMCLKKVMQAKLLEKKITCDYDTFTFFFT